MVHQIEGRVGLGVEVDEEHAFPIVLSQGGGNLDRAGAFSYAPLKVDEADKLGGALVFEVRPQGFDGRLFYEVGQFFYQETSLVWVFIFRRS